MINSFFNWCVKALELIGEITGMGYELANIVVFVVLQPALIVLFYILWRREKIKNTREHWKKKRSNVINIIKMAYEKRLISSKPTGDKYQATIRPTKTKLIDNFDKWTRNEKENFGLYKRTITTRAIDDSIINQKQEELPDRERIRKVLSDHPKEAPAMARLVQRVSLVYGLRKRIKKGV